MNSQSNALRGALWMLGAVLSFAAMAIAVRELQRHMGVFEMLFCRSVVMLAIVAALLARPGRKGTVRTHRIALHVTRNLLHFAGQYSWVYSIGALALATVFAIEFTMPVWTAILAATLLGERLNQGRIVQLVLGLAGVLIILRPGAGVFHPAALVMIFGSLCYAATMICTKQLSATDSPLTVLLWMSIVQTPITLVAAIPQWVMPVAADAPWIFVLGAGSSFAHYCLTRAMTIADATVVVPVDFIRLPLIAVVGALFYAEPFDPMVIVGAAVIFAGTYYSLARERRMRAAT